MTQRAVSSGSPGSSRALVPTRPWPLLLAVVAVSALLLIFPQTIAAAETKPIDSFTRQLDEEVPELARRYRVPGTALAFVAGGRVVWTRGYGFADVASGKPVTDDTIFQAASISKSVAAWGVMRLVEQGTLDLDAPVERYLTRWTFPPSQFHSGDVTARRLLSHTSGLSAGLSTGYGGFQPGYPLPSLEDSLAGKTTGADGVRITAAPGSVFNYSGANYLVLQLLVEEITDLPFAAYLHREVLAPLGMSSSSYSWTPELQVDTARPYDAWGNPLPNYIVPEQAAGGLYTTASDLARFVAAHLPGPGGQPVGRGVLSAASVREMLTAQPATEAAPFHDRWGLGFQLSEAGTLVVQHSGDNIGWKTWLIFGRDTDSGLVVLTNSDRGAALAVELTRRWLRWAGAGDDLGVWALSKKIDTGLIITAGVLVLALIPYGWRLVSRLRSGRRRFGLRPPGSSRRRTGLRLLLLGGVPVTFLIGWWLLAYRLPLLGGFTVKYPYSAVLPLSLRYLTVALALWCLALVATACSPRTRLQTAEPPHRVGS